MTFHRVDLSREKRLVFYWMTLRARIKRGELAKSNAQLVERIVTIAEALNIEVATPHEARGILGLGKG